MIAPLLKLARLHIHMLLATLLSLLVNTPVCAQISTDVQKLESELVSTPNNANKRVQLGRQYLKLKMYDKVIATLNPYTDVIPTPGFLDLASAYQEKKDYTNQVRILKLLRTQNEESPQAHFILGHALMNLSSVEKNPHQQKKIEEEAIASFRVAQRLKPKYREVYDVLLSIFLKSNNRYEARAMLNDMITAFGKQPQFYNELCRLYALDSFIEPAIENCQLAISISPKYPDNFVYLAMSYKDKKEQEKAGKTLSSAAKNFPQSEFVQRAAGQFFSNEKNYPVAAKYFQQAVIADPKSAISQLGLAVSLFENGDYKTSLNHYKLACEIDRTYADFVIESAAKLRQKGESSLSSQYSAVGYLCKK